MANWTVPGYTETRVLGAGGTGRVVEAVHDQSGARLAVKYLGARLCSDESFRERLRAETAALSGLDHPNVVRVRGLVETGIDAAVVRELVEGLSLRQVLAVAAPLSPQAALTVLRQSLLGLGVVQYLGIAHHDFKPANVLLTAEGVSKLVDFGIAERSGAMVPAAGTPSYMAPELWEGAAAGPATDVYAATVTLYECLTGRVPYIGDSVFELQTMHRAAPIPISDVPPALQQLLAQGLAKTPEARPTAVAFLTKIEEAATAEYGPGWEERGQHELAALVARLSHGSRASAADSASGFDNGDEATDTRAWTIGALTETTTLPTAVVGGDTDTDTDTHGARAITATVAPRSPRKRAAGAAANGGEARPDDGTSSWNTSHNGRPGLGRRTKAGIAVAAIAVIGAAVAAIALGPAKSTPAASGPSGQIVSAPSDSDSSQNRTTTGAAPGAGPQPGVKTTGVRGLMAASTPGTAKSSTAPDSSITPVVTGTQIGMSLPSQISDTTTAQSWPSSQASSTAPGTTTTPTTPTSSTPSQTPSSTVTISATAQAVNGTYTGPCPPTQGPTIKGTFTVAGLPSDGTVTITYHWHLTDGAGGDGAGQTATAANGDTSFQLTVNPQQSTQQPASNSVIVDWTADNGISGTTNKVPVTINCQ